MAQDFFALTQEQKEMVISKFQKYYVPGDKKECWMWTGLKYQRSGKNGKNGGYGRLTFYSLGIDVYAHRFAWMLRYNTRVPSELYCCHTCDVRDCVNPHHIKIADSRENTLDAVARGRWKNRGKHQMPIEERVKIVQEYISGATGKELKKKYGISNSRASTWLRTPQMIKRFGMVALENRKKTGRPRKIKGNHGRVQ